STSKSGTGRPSRTTRRQRDSTPDARRQPGKNGRGCSILSEGRRWDVSDGHIVVILAFGRFGARRRGLASGFGGLGGVGLGYGQGILPTPLALDFLADRSCRNGATAATIRASDHNGGWNSVSRRGERD